ncbi:amidase [Labrys neptuniae]
METIRDGLEMVLGRIDGGDSGRHVFTRLYHQAARAAADAADARRRTGLTLGPLDGTLVSIKDLFDIAGEVTLAGSQVLAGGQPARADALVVRRLRRAGAVILGKTNMVEFGFSSLGLNPHFGTPANAVAAERIPGGSSSGAGVSVGEGTSEIAIGSDTAGSIRVPAAFNAIVGFKPTAGRHPRDGVLPFSPSLDSIGPLARSVQACADADAIMAGEEPRGLARQQIAGLRLGIPAGRLLDGLDDKVADAFERARRHLSDRGAVVTDITIDDLLTALAQAIPSASIPAIESAAIHWQVLQDGETHIDPRVARRMRQGSEVAAPAYIRALRKRIRLCAAMDERLRPHDALMLPTVAITPPLLAPLIGDDALYLATNAQVLRNTVMANLFDLTAISLPLPWSSLPTGLMLVGRHGSDRQLLEIAAGVEAILPKSPSIESGH